MDAIFILILLTLVPFLELRASIPYGIFNTDLHWSIVFLVCVVTNILLGPVLYVFYHRVIQIFLNIGWINRCWKFYVERTRKRVKKYVEKYGTFGIALFIGVPLPGSGSYSGGLGAYILGMKFRDFVMANILGVLIAGSLVLVASMTGNGIMQYFIKVI